jgi:NurA-like 5'-3' nuclease
MSVTQDALQAAYDNYGRILLMVTMQIQAPTQANVDAISAAIKATGTGTGTLVMKPTYSLDGESYDWVGYQSFIIQQMLNLKTLIAVESGPYEVRSYGV